MNVLDNLEKRILALIDAHKVAQEQISALTDECSRLNAENDRLLRMIDAEKSTASSLISESEALKQSIDKLINHIDGLGC